MRNDIKVVFYDTLLLRDGSIGKVVEFDNQAPYTIKVVCKTTDGGVKHKWIRTEDVEQVLPRI